MNYRNMIIDGSFPILFWGVVYLSLPLLHVWTWNLYTTWFMAVILFSPLSAVSGRVLNRYRTITGYSYKRYN